MAKVKAQVKLFKDPQRGWVMILMDQNRVKADAVDKFIKHDNTQSIILDAEIRRPFIEKSLSQLGYLHAAVWPVFYAYYATQGQPAETPEQKENIRNDVKYAIGFVEHIERRFITSESEALASGSKRIIKVKSFADASKEETSEAIDAIIRLAADFGMIIQSPQEYLKGHGATEFES